jgi:hypothetical protein
MGCRSAAGIRFNSIAAIPLRQFKKVTAGEGPKLNSGKKAKKIPRGVRGRKLFE